MEKKAFFNVFEIALIVDGCVYRNGTRGLSES